MWIAFRLILAIAGYVIRQFSRGRTRAADKTYQGIPCFEAIHRNKSSITGFTIGMKRRSPTWLRMHAESSIDRFFKRLGVANEVQTGDPRFDDKVYVTCDHPYVTALLQESPALRSAICNVFEAGYERVAFNGSTVSIQRGGNMGPSPRDYKLLQRLHAASARLEKEMPSRFADPFLWKALVVEGGIWGIFGYAIGAGVQMVVQREDVHTWQRELFKAGLVAAFAAFIVLVGIIVLWMRGSSRGHRVIVESALVLLIGLPTTGIQLVGDTNRALDDTAPMVVTRRLEQCEIREHRGKGGRRSYSYHFWLVPEPEASGPRLPREIEVTQALCDAASPSAPIELELGRGRWSISWYRRITVGAETWSSPL